MKYLVALLFLLLFLVLISSAASATEWGGIIGVYPDGSAQFCGVTDTPRAWTFYVIQKFSLGSSGSRFRVELSPGFTGTLLSVTAPGAEIEGDVLYDASVIYTDGCRTGSFVVLELNTMLYGTSPDCSWVRTASYLPAGSLDSYNCKDRGLVTEWAGTHIDPQLGVACPDLYPPEHLPPGCHPGPPPLATEQRTWGAVKALYR